MGGLVLKIAGKTTGARDIVASGFAIKSAPDTKTIIKTTSKTV